MSDVANTEDHEFTTSARATPRKHKIRMTKVKAIREQVQMTQLEFADAYHIPLSRLRNWEQGYKKPDATTSAYLKVISRWPLEIKGALKNRK